MVFYAIVYRKKAIVIIFIIHLDIVI